MEKGDRLIMVVKREFLFKDDYFEGFRPQSEKDYSSRILQHFEYIKRKEAEVNPVYKQPIAYCIIVNPRLRQVFAYQRALEDLRCFERRLQGKWSWGLGGHIEQVDVKNGNPIHMSLLRELSEEVDFHMAGTPELLGYINDDNDDVGKVHFGILYVLHTDSRIVRPKSLEIKIGKLMPLERIEEICSSPDFIVEDWSRISFNPLKSYLYETTLA